MKEKTNNDVETLPKPRTKITERDCPRCNYVIVQNEKEECYECENCGYVDCGDE
jgi:transposase